MRAPRKRSALANLVQYQTRYGRRSVNVVGQICAKHLWHSGGIGNARERRAKVSWQATDAVLHLFDRKDKVSEFIMLFAIAHHYNDMKALTR